MPSNTLVGAIRVEASIDAGKFIDGARRLSNTSKATEREVKAAFSGISSAIKGGIAGFTGALSVGGFIELVKGGLDYAASLKTVSQQLGITTKDLQTMRFAAAQVGVTNEQLENGFQFLEKSIGKANAGSAEMQKAFASVGVTLKDLQNDTPTEIFAKVADGMQKQGGAARNAAAATALLGKSASDLNPLLDQGSAGLDSLRQAFADLGIELDEHLIESATVAKTRMGELNEILEANIASAVAENADAINTLASALANLIRWTGQAVQGWKTMIAEFNAFGSAIGSDIGNAFRGGGRFTNPLAAVDAVQKQQRFRDIALNFGDFPFRNQRPSGNVPQFLAPPRTGGSRRSGGGRAPADRSDELRAQFEQEQLRADQAILQAKQQLASSNEQRLSISLQLIDIERQLQDAEIDEKVSRAKRDLAEGKITQAAYDEIASQSAILKSKADTKSAVEKQALVEEQLARASQAQFEASDQQRKFALDALHAALDAATTQEDRRRIQLQILDAEIEQKRLQLENNKQLAIRNGATADEIKVIQDQIDNLPNERAQGAAGIVRNTRNPIEEWGAAIPKTAAEMKEALQSIETQGLDGLTDAIEAVITGTEKLKDAFHNLAASVLSDLLKMAIKMLIFKSITAAFGGGSFGGGGAMDFSGIGSGLNTGLDFSSVPVTGFATGGSMVIGGRSGTDKNLLSLNGLPIAKVSMGERLNISNDNDWSGSPFVLHMNNDFRGVDPSSVARLEVALNQLKTELPSRIVSTMADKQARTFGKSK